MRGSWRFLALILSLTLTAVVGCGGGSRGGGPTTTTTSLDVNWPARTRDISAPASALAAVATIPGAKPGGGDVVWTINRDPGTAAYTGHYTSDPVTIGAYQVSVKFFAQPDGTGSVVGVASSPVTIAPGHSLGTLLTVGTVTSVTLAPNQRVGIGQTVDLAYTVKDASGNLLAVTPGSAVFSQSSGAGALSVTPSGSATGLTLGSAAVTASVDGVSSPPVQVLAAPSYTVTDLGVLPGMSSSYATALNNQGQVVGYSGNLDAQQNGPSHPFLYQSGQLTDLSPTVFGTNIGAARSINDAGAIVGLAVDPARGTAEGFLLNGSALTDLGPGGGQSINRTGQVVIGLPAKLWQNGTATVLSPPSGISSLAGIAISDAGAIVAQGILSDGSLHTVLVTGGTATDLSTFGGVDSLPSAIGSAGQIVGRIDTDNQGTSTPFLWQNGTVTRLGLLPGDNFGLASGINTSGMVVGKSGRGSGTSFISRAFVWQNGTLLDLNDLIPTNSGWVLEAASAINDHSQIVGFGLIGGQKHAFLLTPQ